MIALVFYIALTAAVVGVVVWVVDRGGDVTMVWGAWEISTTTPILVLGAVLFATAAVVVVRLLSWLWRGPRRLRLAMGRRRKEKGYRELTSGLVAVAAGDASEARRHARKADRLLGQPPFTLLLTAQAAQLDGDHAEAERRFRAMLDKPETEFLGLRGLTAAALRRGDRAAAGEYARRAHALRPDAGWAADVVFELQTLEGDWQGAEHTLGSARDRKLIEAGSGRRRHAALLVERARKALDDLDRAQALGLARDAHAKAPDLAPATALLARLLIDEEKLRPAIKAIEKGWASSPHPDLADLYIRAGRDEGLARYKRILKLARIAPQARESHIVAARTALDSQLTGEARRHLQDLGPEDMSARVARLWAAVEESEGHAGEAARWLAQAADADAEWAWQCNRCGHVSDAWHAVCKDCGGFDTAVWRRPGSIDLTTTMPSLRPSAVPIETHVLE